MGSLIDTAVDDALLFVKVEGESTLQAKAIADEMSRAEISHLQAQNALLSQMLEAENTKAEKAKQELVQHMSSLLDDFVAARHQELSEAFGAVVKGNARAEEELGKFGQRHERLVDHANCRGTEFCASFARKGAEGKRLRDGAIKVISSTRYSASHQLSSLQVQLKAHSRMVFQRYNCPWPRQQQHTLENSKDTAKPFRRRLEVVLIDTIGRRGPASRLQMQWWQTCRLTCGTFSVDWPLV